MGLSSENFGQHDKSGEQRFDDRGIEEGFSVREARDWT